MNCKKCGEPLPENALFCDKCGVTTGFDKLQNQSDQADEQQTNTPTSSQPIQQSAQDPIPLFEDYVRQSAAGEERKVPKGFSSKKNIIIIIIAAIVLIVGGVTSVAVGTNGFDFTGVRTTLQLADRYLSEQNYEQAIIEFEKVLEIEPMNVDAYLGLAEAYMALGETDKAIKILEEGIEKTGSDKLKDKLEEIRNGLKPVTTEAEVTTISGTEGAVVTIAPAETTTAVATGDEVTSETIGETVAVDTEIEPEIVTTVAETVPVVTITTTKAETIVTTTTTTTTTIKPEPVVTEPPVEEETVTILGIVYHIATTDYLSLGNHGITDEILRDITPEIKKLTNIRQLRLDNNPFTDITPLAQLDKITNLEDLYLYENRITDITPLAKLTNVTWIDLRDNQITDITPLGKLTNLTGIRLRDNQITDIAPLGKLTNLTKLYLSRNQITDITPLTNLTNLEYLDLDDNPISKQDIDYLRSKLPNCAIRFDGITHQP